MPLPWLRCINDSDNKVGPDGWRRGEIKEEDMLTVQEYGAADLGFGPHLKEIFLILAMLATTVIDGAGSRSGGGTHD